MVQNRSERVSRWVDLDGPVHYVDHGGPAGAPLAVLVHGLGGSHANWTPLAALLTGRFRVLAVDLPGFGLTEGSPRSTTVPANRRLLDRFLAAVADGPVTLVGNSMGGLISALQAAKNPASVERLVLIDPALPVPLHLPSPDVLSTFALEALPTPVRRAVLRRRGPRTVEQVSGQLLRLVYADPSAVTQAVLDEHAALARRRAGHTHALHDMSVAAQSLFPFLGWGRSRLNATLRSIRQPVLLLHGDQDKLVNIRSARIAARANPRWRFEVARGIGHVPMLEAPEWTAEQILDWSAGSRSAPG